MIQFFVPGLPAPQGSKNAFGIRNKAGEIVGVNVVESSSKTLKPWRTDVKMYAHQAMKDVDAVILDGPVSLFCHFVMKRPVGTPKTRSTPPAVKKPDLDKLVRAIGDAVKGVAYTEDSKVVEIVATKRIAEQHEQPGCFIRIGEGDVPIFTGW